MTHNLKTSGLVLIAVLAIGATVASAAQATLTATVAQYPAWLTAEPIGVLTAVTNTGQELTCTGVTGRGTIKESGVGDTEGQVEAIKYSGCAAKIGTSSLPATVNMTGCIYRPHGGEENTPGHFINGLVDLVCPKGVTGPDMTIFATVARHIANEPLCTYTFEALNNAGGLTGQNTAGEAGAPNTVLLKVSNLETPVTRDGSLLCGSPHTAFLSGEATVKAYEDLGEEGGTPIEGQQIGVTGSES